MSESEPLLRQDQDIEADTGLEATVSGSSRAKRWREHVGAALESQAVHKTVIVLVSAFSESSTLLQATTHMPRRS